MQRCVNPSLVFVGRRGIPPRNQIDPFKWNVDEAVLTFSTATKGLYTAFDFVAARTTARTKVLLGFALQRSLFLAVAPPFLPEKPSPAPPPLYPFDIDRCRFNRSIIHVKWINKETRLGGVVFVNKSCQSDDTMPVISPTSIAASRTLRTAKRGCSLPFKWFPKGIDF